MLIAFSPLNVITRVDGENKFSSSLGNFEEKQNLEKLL